MLTLVKCFYRLVYYAYKRSSAFCLLINTSDGTKNECFLVEKKNRLKGRTFKNMNIKVCVYTHNWYFKFENVCWWVIKAHSVFYFISVGTLLMESKKLNKTYDNGLWISIWLLFKIYLIIDSSHWIYFWFFLEQKNVTVGNWFSEK